jgi:hypothetical protein
MLRDNDLDCVAIGGQQGPRRVDPDRPRKLNPLGRTPDEALALSVNACGTLAFVENSVD